MAYYDKIHLTPYERDQLIIKLRQRGFSYRRIGKAVGMDASGVYRAWQRLQAGGQGTRPRYCMPLRSVFVYDARWPSTAYQLLAAGYRWDEALWACGLIDDQGRLLPRDDDPTPS
jgi:hypothetical protein